MAARNPSRSSTPRLTLINWMSFSVRLFWLLALLPAAFLARSLDIKVILIFLAWISYAVLLVFMRPVINGWLLSSVDVTLAVMMITMSGGFSSPMWAALLLGSTIISLARGTLAGVLLAGAGVLAAGAIQFLFGQQAPGKLLAWFLYLGPILLSAAVIGRILEPIKSLLNLPTHSRMHSRKKTALRLENTSKLFHLAAELNASLNYDRVIATTLELSANALSGDYPVDDHLVGAVLMFEEDLLVIKADRGLTRADRRASFPASDGLLADAINSGDPCLLEDPSKDPELQQLVALHPCHQALAVPLVIGMETYGVLLIAHPMPGYFADDRIELMEAVGQQVMVALQNARLYRDLEQEKDRIMRIEEEARNKLARDLHDGPTQSIAAIAMRVNFARRLLDRSPEKSVTELEKVEDLARTTTREIRHMLFTLRPLILESQGLIAALHQLAEKLDPPSNQQITIDIPKELVDKLDMRKQGVLFYIAEEAVHNAVKHAQAEHITLRLLSDAEYITMQIEDDGVGFNLGAVDRDYHQRGSLGLVNMRERAELLNGLLTISSSEGQGTLITATIPATDEAARSLHTPGLSTGLPDGGGDNSTT